MSLLVVKNIWLTWIVCVFIGSHWSQLKPPAQVVVIVPPRLGVSALGAVSLRKGTGPADVSSNCGAATAGAVVGTVVGAACAGAVVGAGAAAVVGAAAGLLVAAAAGAA